MKKNIDIYDDIYTIIDNQFCCGEVMSKYDDHGKVAYEFMFSKPVHMLGQIKTVIGDDTLFVNVEDLIQDLKDRLWGVK